MRGISQQDHRDSPVTHLQPMPPLGARDARKTQPLGRTTKVRGIAPQGSAIEHEVEEAFTKCDRFFGGHAVQSCTFPHIRRRLDDERACFRRELVRMRLEPTRRRFPERKGKGVEFSWSAEPDIAAQAQVHVRLVGRCEVISNAAVDSVGGDDDVKSAVTCPRCERGGVEILLVGEVDAELAATLLKDGEHAMPADAAEAVSTGSNRSAGEVDLDVVPMVQRA